MIKENHLLADIRRINPELLPSHEALVEGIWKSWGKTRRADLWSIAETCGQTENGDDLVIIPFIENLKNMGLLTATTELIYIESNTPVDGTLKHGVFFRQDYIFDEDEESLVNILINLMPSKKYISALEDQSGKITPIELEDEEISEKDDEVFDDKNDDIFDDESNEKDVVNDQVVELDEESEDSLNEELADPFEENDKASNLDENEEMSEDMTVDDPDTINFPEPEDEQDSFVATEDDKNDGDEDFKLQEIDEPFADPFKDKKDPFEDVAIKDAPFERKKVVSVEEDQRVSNSEISKKNMDIERFGDKIVLGSTRQKFKNLVVLSSGYLLAVAIGLGSVFYTRQALLKVEAADTSQNQSVLKEMRLVKVSDLEKLNQTVADLRAELTSVRGRFEESLAAERAKIQANFEERVSEEVKSAIDKGRSEGLDMSETLRDRMALQSANFAVVSGECEAFGRGNRIDRIYPANLSVSVSYWLVEPTQKRIAGVVATNRDLLLRPEGPVSYVRCLKGAADIWPSYKSPEIMDNGQARPVTREGVVEETNPLLRN